MTKPILFSGAMVRAILDDRKDKTRRVVKPKHQPFIDNLLKKFLGGEWGNRPLPFQPGMKLWVRETFLPEHFDDSSKIYYRADIADGLVPEHLRNDCRWYPSIFMPRWASRITLEVVSVRVERLQEITEEDAVREGCTHTGLGVAADEIESAREQFQRLWDSINGKKYPWDSNPFVWVVEFKRVLND